MKTIQYACRVERGLRDSNDDRALMNGSLMNESSSAGEENLPLLAVVCDGCGGYAGGGIAAQTVLGVFAEREPEELLEKEYLEDTLELCRQKVYEKKAEMPQFSEMCTTVAGCLFCEDRTVIFHAGDSRVYRFDGRRAARMTVDHSMVQEMVDMGLMTPEEARVSPARSTITRCIGIDCQPPEIYVSPGGINPGETYLICSDGLWECLTPEEIRELLGGDGTLAEKADRLIARAMENGSDDNLSVCLCGIPGTKAAEKPRFVLD